MQLCHYCECMCYAATKVEVVHNRRARVSSSGHLTFNNGTDLLPFPNRVNVVTFTWLTGREEVGTCCRLYACYIHCSLKGSCNACVV